MILLFNARAHAGKKPLLPVSLLAVAAPLDGHIPYRIIDGNHLDDPIETLTQAIRDTDAKILALTVMPGPQTASSYEATVEIKKRFPNLVIVWGGYFPTMYPEAVMACPAIDYAIRGYIASDLTDFFASVLEGSPDTTLPGLVYRTHGTRESRSNQMARLVDINELPPFAYHAVDVEFYMRPTFLGSRTISHHVSLGCPFKCAFCGVVNMVNGQTTAETAVLAAKGIERLVVEHGANAVELLDNNFFLGEKRTKQFAELITEFNIGWWAYGRADTLVKYSDETWAALAKSGLKMVYVGAETGSDETLKLMNKGGKQTVQSVLDLVAVMHRHGIVPELSFIIGNPPDPEKDIGHTISMIRKVKKSCPDAEIILYSYTPVPQENEFFQSAADTGFEFPTEVADWSSEHWQKICQRRDGELPWITPQIQRQIRNFRLVLDSAYPTRTDTNLGGVRRKILQLAGGWRFATSFYSAPLELRVLNRLIPYQRPETAGF